MKADLSFGRPPELGVGNSRMSSTVPLAPRLQNTMVGGQNSFASLWTLAFHFYSLFRLFPFNMPFYYHRKAKIVTLEFCILIRSRPDSFAYSFRNQKPCVREKSLARCTVLFYHVRGMCRKNHVFLHTHQYAKMSVPRPRSRVIRHTVVAHSYLQRCHMGWDYYSSTTTVDNYLIDYYDVSS